MTELQSNDLVSKLGAASPVENIQADQVNLSNNQEKTVPNQVIMNGEPPQNVTIPNEEANGVINSVENNTINIPSTEAVNNTNVNNITPNEINNSSVANNVLNDIVTPQSSSNPSLDVTAHFGEQTHNNAIINEMPRENGANLNGAINEIVSTEPQKISNIVNSESKTESKAEYWKGLVSGILVSICLFATGAILYDHGSLVVSASNTIKLTDNNTANEIVKMEDAVAFGDSLSNNYINNLLGKEENENILNEINVDDINTEIQTGDDEDLDENNVDVIDDEVDNEEINNDEDEIDNEDSDENDVGVIDDEVDNEEINDEDETQDDGKLITKNDKSNENKDSLSDNTQKNNNTSSKNKMAGSIVSIFDDNDKENVETNDIDSPDKTSPISYKHVDNVEDANWVISANCDNSHCGDISEANLDELVPCTEFRQSDRLDDSANRIGSNGICRYKDSSELVYIDLD